MVLVVLIGVYRSIMTRYRTTTNQASEAFERFKKAEVRDERRLALSEEMLTLQRETNDIWIPTSRRLVCLSIAPVSSVTSTISPRSSALPKGTRAIRTASTFERTQIGPGDLPAALLLDRPVQPARLVEAGVVRPAIERRKALLSPPLASLHSCPRRRGGETAKAGTRGLRPHAEQLL